MKLINPGYILLISCLVFCSCQRTDPKPNFILLMADDFGWGDAGFNGNAKIQMPNLDLLAQAGITFNRFYSASPVCSPTRASCLTGRNPYRMGIPTANSGHLLESEYTLAEMLREQGYATGHFGKWHLGTFTTTMKDANRGKIGDATHLSVPTQHGFDCFFSSESKVPTWDPLQKPKTFNTEDGESLRYGWAARPPEETVDYGTHYWTDINELAAGDFSGDDTKIIMDQAIGFIQDQASKNKPFFTVIWTHTPHLPVVVDESYANRYPEESLPNQLYFGTLSALDDQVGRLWIELQKLKVDRNTCMFFCSDNGPEVQTPGTAGPFRGKKRDLYEGGVRVPAFCVWPEQIKPGLETDFPIVTSDYMPTIAGILDLKIPAHIQIDGMDISKVFDQPFSNRKKPIGFLFHKRMSWVNQEYKLISYDQGETFELYNLLNDPGEQHNLAAIEPDQVETLKNELSEWLLSLPNPEIPGFKIPQIPENEAH